ncbi:MAG TPA: DUF3299 domain-containing protein [Candidatus Limnocylindria bacterium]|jgi:hypothetical protein|nr:DUF3299 domain-containing protein [Candidatus Limnocylindria bacterium]
MKHSVLIPRLKTVGMFAAVTLVSSLYFRIPQTALGADKPARGEPIKPLAPARGEPIKPLAPGAGEAAGTPTAAAASATDGDFAIVGFDKLSTFKYDVPDDATTNAVATAKNPDEQIPTTVKAFSGKRVSLKGFMLPLKVEGGLVTELLIMRDQSMCCYGAVPKINEWVAVKMTGKGVKPIMDQAVTMYGTLKVGAIRENGYLVGIYQLDGEKMKDPVGM